MGAKLNLNSVYFPSEDVLARNVHGEFIIIPITGGANGSYEDIFSLNKFGKAIWNKLDGKRSLKDIINALALHFEGSIIDIESDVLGFIQELLEAKIIVKL